MSAVREASASVHKCDACEQYYCATCGDISECECGAVLCLDDASMPESHRNGCAKVKPRCIYCDKPVGAGGVTIDGDSAHAKCQREQTGELT